MNKQAEYDDDIIEKMIEEEKKRDLGGHSHDSHHKKHSRIIQKPQKMLKVLDDFLKNEIKKEYEHNYHGKDEKMKRLDIKDYGRNLF